MCNELRVSAFLKRINFSRNKICNGIDINLETNSEKSLDASIRKERKR